MLNQFLPENCRLLVLLLFCNCFLQFQHANDRFPRLPIVVVETEVSSYRNSPQQFTIVDCFKIVDSGVVCVSRIDSIVLGIDSIAIKIIDTISVIKIVRDIKN